MSGSFVAVLDIVAERPEGLYRPSVLRRVTAVKGIIATSFNISACAGVCQAKSYTREEAFDLSIRLVRLYLSGSGGCREFILLVS